MKILIACEESQTVCKAFRAKGHEAYSCDILPCSGEHPEWHIQGDVLEHLNEGWDMMIAHPPCTYLSRVSARFLYGGGKINQERYKKGIEAKEFFMKMINAPIEKIAVENPTPFRIFELPPYTQVVQPYQFGHEFSKRTLLWLKNLPPLKSTKVISEYKPFLPSNTGGAKRGQKHSKGFSKNQQESSKTFQGIADAMASQWG